MYLDSDLLADAGGISREDAAECIREADFWATGEGDACLWIELLIDYSSSDITLPAGESQHVAAVPVVILQEAVPETELLVRLADGCGSDPPKENGMSRLRAVEASLRCCSLSYQRCAHLPPFASRSIRPTANESARIDSHQAGSSMTKRLSAPLSRWTVFVALSVWAVTLARYLP